MSVVGLHDWSKNFLVFLVFLLSSLYMYSERNVHASSVLYPHPNSAQRALRKRNTAPAELDWIVDKEPNTRCYVTSRWEINMVGKLCGCETVIVYLVEVEK